MMYRPSVALVGPIQAVPSFADFEQVLSGTTSTTVSTSPHPNGRLSTKGSTASPKPSIPLSMTDSPTRDESSDCPSTRPLARLASTGKRTVRPSLDPTTRLWSPFHSPSPGYGGCRPSTPSSPKPSQVSDTLSPAKFLSYTRLDSGSTLTSRSMEDVEVPIFLESDHSATRPTTSMELVQAPS